MFKGFSIAKVSDKFKIPCLLLSLRLYSSIKKENIIFPVGVCAGVDVDVLLVDAPAWPVAAGAHRDAAAEVLGVICHAGVTAMPLPRSTNQSPCSHQTVLRCFAMQTS